jgi:hypothetical protein
LAFIVNVYTSKPSKCILVTVDVVVLAAGAAPNSCAPTSIIMVRIIPCTIIGIVKRASFFALLQTIAASF